jgi:hypothetical protein
VLCSGLSPTQESHAVWKNADGKTGVPVFLLFHYFLITQKEKLTERKTRTRVFPVAFFKRGCDSCVGDKPEQSTRT